MAENDRAEQARVLLADRLRKLQAAGFLDFDDVVRHVDLVDLLPRGLAKLATLVGFDKIAGAFYDNMERRDERVIVLRLWEVALRGNVPLLFEQLINLTPTDKRPGIFQRWIADECFVTWEQLTLAFPYRVLRACAAEGDKRADDAAVEPATEVVEEEVEVINPGEGPDGK